MIEKLECMPEPEFQAFFKQLPERTQMMVRTGLCDWRRVLPEWYVKIYGSTSDTDKNKVHA